jgi:hypothetical protein
MNDCNVLHTQLAAATALGDIELEYLGEGLGPAESIAMAVLTTLGAGVTIHGIHSRRSSNACPSVMWSSRRQTTGYKRHELTYDRTNVRQQTCSGRFNNFAGAQAAGAHMQAGNAALHNRAHLLNVGILFDLRLDVRVGKLPRLSAKTTREPSLLPITTHASRAGPLWDRARCP